jgi:hypothetical protein
MPPAPKPILASARTAAHLLDMKPAEFRDLVSVGALPKPIRPFGQERWRVADLEAIASGEALEDGFET